MTSKIVVLGALRGKFDVFQKLSKLQSKQNFALAVICGDLFADPTVETESDDIQKLIDGSIPIPLPTYFTIGHYALPPKIIDRLAKNNNEVCDNLFFLGKRSIFKTSEGIRIVALGGSLNANIIGNSEEDKYLPFHTETDAKVLHGAHNADILITSNWPSHVRNGSKVALAEGAQEPSSEQCVSDLVKALKPRYHFCASPDLFYEREPFFFRPTENTPDVKPVTRFISLASPGAGPKYLYAFNLDATGAAPTSLPAGATPTPFLSPKLGGKRTLPNQFNNSYRYSNPDRDGYGGYNTGKRRRRERAAPTQAECFFCLSNSPSTHLITAIGEDAYLTTSRGPVPTKSTFSPFLGFPAHILIIPLAHAPTIASIPTSAGDNLERQNSYAEMLRFRRNLNEMLLVKGEGKLGSVCWEINKQAGVHVHWQWMPIPVDMIQKNLVEAGLKVQAEGDGCGSFEKKEVGDGVNVQGDWFRIWVWQPSKDDGTQSETKPEGDDELAPKDGNESMENHGTQTSWFMPLDPTQKFDLQFGRRVMAKLLDTPQRAHWKDVVQSVDEEKKDAQAFKVAFKNWDFTGTA